MSEYKELGLEVIHFLLDLFADEVLGMSGDLVRFVAENKQWDFLPHNTSLGQYIIQIPSKKITKNKDFRILMYG